MGIDDSEVDTPARDDDHPLVDEWTELDYEL
jgi:hypothetical protein